MVISLEDYRLRRRQAAAQPAVRLAAVARAASAAVASPASLLAWQPTPAVLGLSASAGIDPRLLYADATLI